MKPPKLIILSITLLAVFYSNAQNTNKGDAINIKERKIIIALAEYPKKASDWEKEKIDIANESLKEAVEKYWSFSEIKGVLTRSEARKALKEDRSLSYITIEEGQIRSNSKPTNRVYVTYAERLAIYASSMSASVWLPKYEGDLSLATATYAVTQLNKILELLLEGKFNSLLTSGKYVKSNGPKIIEKTLLIADYYINPEISRDDLKLHYPYDLEVTSLEKIEKAILEKDPKYAVAYYVPIPVGRNFLHRVYISNAADGDIYGVLDGHKVSLDFGSLGHVGGKGKSLINEKELKELAKIVD